MDHLHLLWANSLALLYDRCLPRSYGTSQVKEIRGSAKAAHKDADSSRRSLRSLSRALTAGCRQRSLISSNISAICLAAIGAMTPVLAGVGLRMFDSGHERVGVTRA